MLVRAKGTDRLFLGELRGRIYSFPDDPGCQKADLALDLAKVYPDLTALYGLTFHPDFDKNRFVYVCYVRKNDVPDGSVVSRFTVEPDRSAGDRSRRVNRSFSNSGRGDITAAVLTSATMDIFIFPPETPPSLRLRTS